jgi:hypothetical protein
VRYQEPLSYNHHGFEPEDVSYLALQQAGGGNTDLGVLKESSEKLKEQLAAEIGPIAVHDLMQGE